MDTVTMVELRQHADKIVRRVMNGQRLVLTYRGKAVMRLEPMEANQITEDDPIYGLADLADADAESLSNEQIDDTIYGE